MDFGFMAGLRGDVINKSFNSCVLNLLADGSEDNTILCLKEGQLCRTGRAMLQSKLGILSEPETNPFEFTDSDFEEACPTQQLLDSDHKGDSDVDIE